MRSISVNLFVYFVVCIVLAVGAVGYASYKISGSVVKNQAAKSAENDLGHTGDKLELWFKFYEQITKQIAADPDIGAQLNKLSMGVSNMERLEAGQKITDKLNSYSFSNQGISAIYLLPEQRDGKSISTSNTFKFSESQYDSDWYQSILASKSSNMWLPIAPTGLLDTSSEPVWSLARIIDAATTGGQVMVLLLELKATLIEDLLVNVKEGGAKRVFMLDADQVVFADTAPGEYVAQFVDEESDEVVNIAYRSEAGVPEQLMVTRRLPGMNWLLVSMTPVSELLKPVDRIFNLTLIAVALSLVLAAVAGFIFSRNISKPIVALSRLMKASEQGDLSGRTQFRRKDEIGLLGASFNEMMDKLSSLVSRTNRSADKLIEHAMILTASSKNTEISSQEIANATEHIANGSMNLALEAEKGVILAQDIDMRMQQSYKANGAMERTADEVFEVSTQGTAYMRKLMDQTAGAEVIIQSLTMKATKFAESASSIRSMLEMLKNISKQTNILALNATIESARQSLQGRGFAVIAKEISLLAKRSKSSIDEAGEVTDLVERESRETIALLEAAQPLFREQMNSAKESEAIFSVITKQMDLFRSQLTELTAISSELGKSQHLLINAVTAVGATAEESCAFSEEVASLGAEQLKVSAKLVDLSDHLTEVSKDLQQSLAEIAEKY